MAGLPGVERRSSFLSSRLLSLDVLRGLTILTMIFANELDMAMIKPCRSR